MKLKVQEYIANGTGTFDVNSLDGMTIDGYNINTSVTGKIVYMTKDNVNYAYLVDTKGNVTELGNMNNSATSSNSDNTSDLITNLSLNITDNNGRYVEVQADATTSDGSNIIGYIYLLNGVAQINSSSNQYIYSNLDMNTNYTFTVCAIDKSANIKKVSQAITTSNKTYIYKEGKEYTYLTNGWKLTTAAGGTGNKSSNYLYLYSPVVLNAMTSSAYSTQKTIDTSKFSKMCCDLIMPQYHNGNGGLYTDYGLFNGNFTTYYSGYFPVYSAKRDIISELITSVNVRQTFTKDITNNTYNLYPIIDIIAGGGAGGDMIELKTYNIWFE